jgi:hypothetical protein
MAGKLPPIVAGVVERIGLKDSRQVRILMQPDLISNSADLCGAKEVMVRNRQKNSVRSIAIRRRIVCYSGLRSVPSSPTCKASRIVSCMAWHERRHKSVRQQTDIKNNVF